MQVFFVIYGQKMPFLSDAKNAIFFSCSPKWDAVLLNIIMGHLTNIPSLWCLVVRIDFRSNFPGSIFCDYHFLSSRSFKIYIHNLKIKLIKYGEFFNFIFNFPILDQYQNETDPRHWTGQMLYVFLVIFRLQTIEIHIGAPF